MDRGSTGLEILNRTGTEPDWSEFGRNRTGTGPDFTISKMGRIEPDGRIFNRILQN